MWWERRGWVSPPPLTFVRLGAWFCVRCPRSGRRWISVVGSIHRHVLTEASKRDQRCRYCRKKGRIPTKARFFVRALHDMDVKMEVYALTSSIAKLTPPGILL